MRYVALLRGINVGGKNLIKMSDLKDVFMKHGFEEVLTYIQSGNVIFSSPKKREQLIPEIEKFLSQRFTYTAKIVLLSQEQLKDILDDVPSAWKRPNDLRCYIAFVRDQVAVADVQQAIKPREGVDSINAGKRVLYLSTKFSGLTKSGVTRFIGTPLYKEITMRNYATIKKILPLL